jgi:2-dehydropantoate 2-reductase
MARVAVVGPGAIGATFAAAVQTALGGTHELLLCGRTPLARVTVERPGEPPLLIDAPVQTDPTRAGGPVDWVLLAVKAHQTDGARGWLQALCGDATTVVVLQNGVEQRALVGPLIAGAELLPAIVWCPAELVEPGRVQVKGEERLVVPEGDAGRRFAALLGGSRAAVELAPDFLTEAWRKLVVNAVAGLMVLSGRRMAMFRRDDVRALSRRLAEECVAVARAEGAALDTDDVEQVVDWLDSLAPDLGSSILFDRLADRPLEWDARNGVIQRRGAAHGIPTPVSDVIVPLLAAASG